MYELVSDTRIVGFVALPYTGNYTYTRIINSVSDCIYFIYIL